MCLQKWFNGSVPTLSIFTTLIIIIIYKMFLRYIIKYCFLMFSVRFAPIRPPQLHLTPINFEIPHTESPPMFIGREWLYREIEQVIILDQMVSSFSWHCIYLRFPKSHTNRSNGNSLNTTSILRKSYKWPMCSWNLIWVRILAIEMHYHKINLILVGVNNLKK